MRARARAAAVVATAVIAAGTALLLPGGAAVADPPVRGAGVWVTASNGGVEAFGDAPSQGSVAVGLDTAVDLAPTPTGRGYWVLTTLGKVLPRGDAVSYGDAPARTQGSFVAIAGTPTGRGYWLMTNKGQLINLGDAPALRRTTTAPKGSTVDLAVTPDGLGAWSVSNQGEVSSFGAAPVLAVPAIKSSVVAIQSTPTGKGYLLASSSGPVAKAGDAVQRGDVTGTTVEVVDMAATYDGRGYWLLLADRTIRPFGSAVALGPATTASSVVALAATPWVNRPPVAGDDAATTDEDTAVTVAVGANDSDPDGDALTFSVRVQPAHGTLVSSLGGLRYSPDQDFFGDDSAVYVASDPYGGTAAATVRFTVNPVNDAPVAGADQAQTDEDTAVLVDVLANDTDVDSPTLTVALAGAPDHGTVELVDGGIRYTPAADFNGLDGFTYTVSDGSGGVSGAGVTIRVLAVDDVPDASDDSYTTRQGVTLTVDAPGVLANDSDRDGDALTAVLVQGPDRGSLTLDADGSFTWVPDPSSYASDSFVYRASGAGAVSAPTTVTLTVVPAPGGGGGFGGFSSPPVEITNDDTYDITAYGDPTNELQLGTVEHLAGQIRYVPDSEVQGTEHLVFSDGRTLDIEVVDPDDESTYTP